VKPFAYSFRLPEPVSDRVPQVGPKGAWAVDNREIIRAAIQSWDLPFIYGDKPVRDNYSRRGFAQARWAEIMSSGHTVAGRSC